VVARLRRHGTHVELVGLNQASAVLVDAHAPQARKAAT
jgi:SulP family sulfate permease